MSNLVRLIAAVTLSSMCPSLFGQSLDEIEAQRKALHSHIERLRNSPGQRQKEIADADRAKQDRLAFFQQLGRDYGVTLQQVEGLRCPCILFNVFRDGTSIGTVEIRAMSPESARPEFEGKMLKLLKEKNLLRANILTLPDRKSVYGYIGEYQMKLDEANGVMLTADASEVTFFDGKTKEVTLRAHPNQPDSLTIVVTNHNGSVQGVEFIKGIYSRELEVSAR